MIYYYHNYRKGFFTTDGQAELTAGSKKQSSFVDRLGSLKKDSFFKLPFLSSYKFGSASFTDCGVDFDDQAVNLIPRLVEPSRTRF